MPVSARAFEQVLTRIHSRVHELWPAYKAGHVRIIVDDGNRTLLYHNAAPERDWRLEHDR